MVKLRVLDPRILSFAKSALSVECCTIRASHKLVAELNNVDIPLDELQAFELCSILAPEFKGLLDQECCECDDCKGSDHCHGDCDADNRCAGCYEHYESGRDATFYADRARGLI